MFRRTFVIIAVVAASFSSLAAGIAHAQDITTNRTEVAPKLVDLLAASAVAPSAVAEPAQFPRQFPPSAYGRTFGHTTAMASLYASTALMQALDVHSSLKAFGAGAIEGNPMMSGIASHKGAFIAVKALVASTTIMAAKQLSKRHKIGAMVMLAAVNGVYGWVASHNYKLAHDLTAGR